jgi:TRAP-type C4-dicarboxylate transport system permease small subunit
MKGDNMKKVINIYKNIMTYIGVIGLIGFIASVLIQVIARTFLPTAPNWTEEAARYLFIYMVAFAGNAAVINDEYVGVELLVEKFPAIIQKIIKLIIYICLLLFSGFLFFKCVLGATGLIAITPATMISTALEIPMKYIYFSEVFLFGFYIISYLLRIYILFSEKKEA